MLTKLTKKKGKAREEIKKERTARFAEDVCHNSCTYWCDYWGYGHNNQNNEVHSKAGCAAP